MQIVERVSRRFFFHIDRLNWQKAIEIDRLTLSDGRQVEIEKDPSMAFYQQSLEDEIHTPIEVKPYEVCPLYFPDNLEDCPLFKIKVKDLSVEEALELLAPIEGRYRIDVNQAWSFEETLAFLGKLNLDHVDFIEEPCADYPSLVKLAKNYPIALDESLAQGVDIDPFETLVVKPSRLAHFQSLIQSQKRIVLSSNFESEVGLMQIVKLAQRSHVKEPLGIDTLKYCRRVDEA